jgi:hypothetical protein
MVANKSYQFNLKFFTYDEVSKEFDYPMPKSFGKIYSPTVELVVSFPYQVMLSQKHREKEKRLDHYDTSTIDYDFPSDTYAYTTSTPFVIQFDHAVYIKSFWVRLHRNPQVFIDRSYGTRTVAVYHNGEKTAETTFVCYSEEWFLIKVDENLDAVVGDTLVMDQDTDVDNIVI